MNPNPRKRKRESDETVFLSRTRSTDLYRQYFENTTVKSTRVTVKEMGVVKWYSMKKGQLVSIVVLDIYARRIQRFFRTRGSNIRQRVAMFSGLEQEKCPITLELIKDIPMSNRYTHSNHWFDRENLAEFLRVSCDFVHPVTRVAFTENDIIDIDPSMLTLFNDRLAVRSAMVSRIEMVQCIENELEDIFKEMIDMAYYTQSRREFDANLMFSEVQFEECFKDLLGIDRDRCIVVLKSLPDLIDVDSYKGMYLSRKRGKELRTLVKDFIWRTIDE